MSAALEEILHRSSVFRFLPQAQHAEVLARFQPQKFSFGDVIVCQGDAADAYYIITAGRARVVKVNEQGQELALNSLRPGEEFGEGALLSGGTRDATVRCSSAVEVLRLDRDVFLELVRSYPELTSSLELSSRLRTLHGFLYEFSNFGRLSTPALQNMVARLTPRQAPRGETIIREGDPPGPMYIVRSGKARASRQVAGRQLNLAFYRDGDYFGELSILENAPRAASVEAVTDCELLALEQSTVLELRDEFPEFARLLDERRAQYDLESEARVPLDFAEEALPADVAVANKTELGPPGDEPAASPASSRPRRRRFGRFPFILQIDEMDCAAACLGMVCRHYGKKVPLVRIRDLCHTSVDGTSLKALCHAASELGLSARAVKVSLRNLNEMPLPAIVHWEGNHWIVLVRVGRKHVHVADPALGLRRIPRAEFERGWSGYAALFDYTTEFENAPEGGATLAWLVPFFRRYTTLFLQVGGLATIATALQMLFPIFTQMVVDQVIVDANVHLLLMVVVTMLVAMGFMVLSNVGQQYLLSFAAVRIDTAILDHLTRTLLALPMRYFGSRRTGDIQNRLDGAQEVRSFVVENGVGGILALAQLAAALALMGLYSLPLLGVFLLTVPLYFVLMFIASRYLTPILGDLQEAHGRYSSQQIDAIKGIEAVKAAGAEPTFRDGMLNQFVTVSRQMFRGNFFFMTYGNAIATISMLSSILFLWVGALLVMNGELTLGGFIAFNTLAMMANGAFFTLLEVWEQYIGAGVLLNRLTDVFDQEPEQGRDRSRLKPVSSLEGRIELRDVSFRYGGPESPLILEDLNIEIAPGKMVALVGRSGSGKTTLIKLLSGLYEPTAGSILLDGMDLKTLNYRDVRHQIGLVLQENHIFDGTILANIGFGDREPDFDRVLRAAEIASAHDFIMRLPLGYETKIGESGLALSGGQRQRISIARALYNDPPILIFDEATSALDTESERAIQENMAQLLVGRTALVIAHRLSTVRDADTIVVLEKGGIAEQGNHEELMATRGLYFYLATQQSGL